MRDLRLEDVTGPGDQVQAAEDDAAPATVHPRNALNDLTAREWISETVSVWGQRGLGANHPDARIERQHPAPFSFTDVARLIRLFSKRGGTVLDPFVGVGSTLKACAIEGRRGIGIELNPHYADFARERLRSEVRDMFAGVADQKILVGDAREAVHSIEDTSVDFLVTSPPYWNILSKEDHKARQERIAHGLDTSYGDDKRDLATISDYQAFLRELTGVFDACRTKLRPKRYAAIVVSDFRHRAKYVMFHADLASALEAKGYELKGIKVLHQRHKKVFPYGYPYSYVPNIHHQFILILYRP